MTHLIIATRSSAGDLKAGSCVLVGTQEIAGSLGLPKTTMRRLVEMDDRLRLSVGPEGSRLELA